MNTSNDIRESLRKMREAKKLGANYEYTPNKKPVVNEGGKHMTMRDMLGRMRKIKEDENQPMEKTTTQLDLKNEQDKLEKTFEEFEVNPTIEDFQVYDEGVFLSGSIDGKLTFTFSVAPSEDGSGIEWNPSEDFIADDPDNEKIIKRLEIYYKEFYKYWRDNELQV